jgi:hypothetical protein
MARHARHEKQGKETTKPAATKSRRPMDADPAAGLPANYWKACELVRDGQYKKARQAYARLEQSAQNLDARVRTLIENDLAVITAMEGRLRDACETWRAVLDGGNDYPTARLNLGLVEAELSRSVPSLISMASGAGLAPGVDGGPTGVSAPRELFGPTELSRLQQLPGRVRVAVLSLLFNWPSTGGGNMHTAGLVEFLGRDGFDVRHFYASHPAWGIGRVASEQLPASTGTEFGESEWNVPEIGRRFRAAVDSFDPDYVVISDTWNMKPHLAGAMRGYRTFFLMQAQECLCPLNNLRLIGIGPAQVEQCPRNQLATPQVCHQCLAERGHHAGALHQVERSLAGVGTTEYDQLLSQSFQDAEAILVLNPITATMLEPYARRVCIVPWGIDPARFPWPTDESRSEPHSGRHHIARDVNPGTAAHGATPPFFGAPRGRHHS